VVCMGGSFELTAFPLPLSAPSGVGLGVAGVWCLGGDRTVKTRTGEPAGEWLRRVDLDPSSRGVPLMNLSHIYPLAIRGRGVGRGRRDPPGTVFQTHCSLRPSGGGFPVGRSELWGC